MDDNAVEKEIQDKGLTAPRITPARIDSLVADLNVHCYVVPGTTTTVATAFLSNGFSVATEISACASPENFDAELGMKIAKKNAEESARKELWRLEGYRLKCQLQMLDNLAEWCDKHGVSLEASQELESIIYGVDL